MSNKNNKNNNTNKVSPHPTPEPNLPLVETPHTQPILPDFPNVLQEPEQKGGRKCKKCILSSS